MDKSRVCINRTINLAKQRCPRKTNVLVYEKSGQPAKHIKPAHLPLTIAAAPAKKIRVCTGAELKKMCRPVPCKCPPKKGRAATFADLVTFGLKGVFAGTIMYWTWDAGLWGDSEETERFYTNVCHILSDGYTKEQKISKACELELDLRKGLPDLEDPCSRPPFSNEKSLYQFKEFWNHLVTFVFEGAVGFPFNLMKWLKQTFGDDECTPAK